MARSGSPPTCGGVFSGSSSRHAVALATVLGCLMAGVSSAAAPSSEHSRKLLQGTGGVLDLALTTLHGATTGFVVYGKDAHDRLGNAVYVGDLNGDGLGDVVVSAFFADGANNTASSAGEVYVLFGQPGGWPDSIDLATITLDGSNGFVVHGKDVNDRLGLAVAIGDVNGDGFQDLAMGAHLGDGSETNVVKSSGEVWVLFGKASGWPASIDLATLVTDGVGSMIIHGMDRWDGLGFSVLIADVNGDGTGDLILGARGGDGSSDINQNKIHGSGEVHVLFGHRNGWSPVVHLENYVLDGKNGLSIYGRDKKDNAGISVTVGDLNGDFKADIILGAIRADGLTNTDHESGEVYIIFGTGRWPAMIDLSTHVLDGYNGLVVYGKDPFDRMGRALAIGDINGDGNQDLAISSHRSDGTDNTDNLEGEVYVLFGRAGWPPHIDLRTKVLTGKDGFVIHGRDRGDRTGFAVAIGDINGDGFGEIIVSAKGGDGSETITANQRGSGEANVIFGHSDVQGWPASFDLDQETLDGTNGFIVYGRDRGDHLGRSVAVGDVNADGFTDLIMGAFTGDGAIETARINDAGEAYVVYGIPKAPKCNPGEYDANHISGGEVSCVSCLPGNYCTGIGAQTRCPVHRTSPAGSSDPSACVCKQGYVLSGSSCIKCGGCGSDEQVAAWCTVDQPTQCIPCTGWNTLLDRLSSNQGVVRSCGFI